ncbi:MAG: cysteine-rich CWC family protein [Bacteroidota bacterium]
METGKHEYKQCAKCNGAFECRPLDIVNCQCSLIQLSDAELHFLQSNYDDCLCIDCLRAIKQEYYQLTKNEFIKRTPLG